jgi:hypothetical protein
LATVGSSRRGVVPAMGVPLSKEAMALVTNSGGATDKLDFELSYLSKMLLLAGDWPPALTLTLTPRRPWRW